MVNNPPANAGDSCSIPGLGRSPGVGSGNLFQYSCLENSMDREAWWATVHGVTELDMSEQIHTYTHLNVVLGSPSTTQLTSKHHISRVLSQSIQSTPLLCIVGLVSKKDKLDI